ncbi:hypothetical protein XOO3231 [Xanthomonas oryzae pv. oryzae KACC 10331]|uniref:Uncharacterized protein n=1 Tax=Xanthomonas oryzae pv. oryzae (strain KACC10331 / KXO85) TaxID=291331 RepID=Q5GXT6_XANOR|nr:hypothetical protein XOO3231 [Xanthomonas oryzae pv. oryzae KACC 10331]
MMMCHVLLQPVQQRVDLLFRQVLVIMTVDDHHRRRRAGSQALFFALEVDAAIDRRLTQLAAQLLFRVRQQIFGAVEPAADVGAERHVVAADLFGLEHRVEAGDLVRPHRRQLQVLGHADDQFVGQPALVLFLCGMQALQHRRTLAIGRKLGQPMIDVRARLVAQHHLRINIARRFEITRRLHRSTSPKTKS